jgi:chorismate-pyruvate lyase
MVRPSSISGSMMPTSDDIAAFQTLISRLSARIAAASSATREVEQWCREHGIGDGHLTVERRQPTVRLEPDMAEAARVLDEPAAFSALAIRFRHITLGSGSVALVEADNWYAPDALPLPMRTALDTTDIPYGRVIESLNPRRRTFFIALTSPDGIEAELAHRAKLPVRDGEGASPAAPTFAFEHRAVLVSESGAPLALVHERYLWDLVMTARYEA